MSAPQRDREIHALLAVALTTLMLGSGCAAAPKHPPAHVSSLASTLSSIQSTSPPSAPSGQPAAKPPNREEGARLFQAAIQQLNQHNDRQSTLLFEQSAAADPTQPATHNNLGILYKRSGQLDKAVEAYQQAVAQQGNYPEAYYNLALAYRTQGQFQQAEQAYVKALSLNSQFADAHYNLGILYDLYLGRPAKALEQYRAYLQLGGPHAQEVTRWAAGLERLVPASPGESAPPPPAAKPAAEAPAIPTPLSPPVTPPQESAAHAAPAGGAGP